MLTLALLTAAHADPVDLELRSRVQHGQGKPALILHVNETASSLDAKFSCSGVSASRSGPAPQGEDIELTVDLPVGQHRCSGALSLSLSDGSEGEMPLNFQVAVLPALQVEVPRDHVDLGARTLQVAMDRPPGRVEVTAYGPGGAVVGGGEALAGGLSAGERFEATWTVQDSDAEVLRLEVRGYDADGFWAAVDLFPWAYDIPHEDVVFPSGEHEIPDSEVPKLRAALAEVRAVEAKYGDFAELQLYVAGYTDTVGSAESNQGLSERRARAIAAWFKANGFSGSISYQGFGESVPAVATPDETDEPANRRAVYLVAAETPPVSAEVPRRSWTKL